MSFTPTHPWQYRRTFALLSLALVAISSSGCATITRGTTEELKVESTPSSANVRLDTGQTGITPASFTVPRKRDIVVTISKEGYEPVTQTVTTKMAGRGAAGMAGNVLIGGVIGIGVDAVTGATLSHYPNPLIVTLVEVPKKSMPEPAPPTAADPGATAEVAPPTAAEPSIYVDAGAKPQ